jgi:hypothetical protein
MNKTVKITFRTTPKLKSELERLAGLKGEKISQVINAWLEMLISIQVN